MPSKDEVEAYLAKHKLSTILQESITELVKEGMPDNPLAVIASKLNAVGNPNVPLAKEAFELQVGLAKGTVDQEMIGQMVGKFSAYFAPEVGWDVPAAGLNARGSFMDMMGAVSPVWMGLVNTKADNVRFDAVSPSMIKITQNYTNHILDNAGAVIEGTAGDILVEHTCTFIDGKISQWHQGYDAELMKNKRDLEVLAKATVYQTPADLGPPAKQMGPEGTGAKMWMFTNQGKKFTRISLDAGFDWVKTISPILPGCPEWCPATHFGYLESGEMGVKLKDGTEKTIKAGESYFIPPGHLPVMDKAAVMIEFSQDETYSFLAGQKPTGGPMPASPDEGLGIFCQPCQTELAETEPTKVMGDPAAKIWMKKEYGRQMARLAISAGFDWAKTVSPMLPGCPDWCPSTHFGYLESGEMGVKLKNGNSYTIKAGESYFIPPGHLPVMDKDAVMIEFSQDQTYTNEKFMAK